MEQPWHPLQTQRGYRGPEAGWFAKKPPIELTRGEAHKSRISHRSPNSTSQRLVNSTVKIPPHNEKTEPNDNLFYLSKCIRWEVHFLQHDKKCHLPRLVFATTGERL